MKRLVFLELVAEEIRATSGIDFEIDPQQSNNFIIFHFPSSSHYIRFYMNRNDFIFMEHCMNGRSGRRSTFKSVRVDLEDPQMFQILIDKIIEWGFVK